MIYGSVCSGIEAATQAWHPLGWSPAFFCEIEKFPSAVLAHHYGSNMPGEDMPANGVPNHGDMTKFQEWPDHAIDLLVGGTPCQSYSIAGLRKGLADPRGDLAITFAAIARRYRPRWLAWENVPGVLSNNSGRDFATILGVLSGQRIEPPAGGWKRAGIVTCGAPGAYGLAWRVLDAQYVRVDGFADAVPQRRERLFVIGYPGDWRPAAAVLLELESLRGDPAPRREAGQAVAAPIASGASIGSGYGLDADTAENLIQMQACFGGGRQGGALEVSAAPAAHGQRQDFEVETFVASVAPSEVCPTLSESGGHARPGDNVQSAGTLIPVQMSVAIQEREVSAALAAHGQRQDVAHTLRGEGFDASEDGTANAILTPLGGRAGIGVGAIADCANWAVRRLTPTECHRLQGFTDGFCDIPWRGKAHAPDGLQYKALGNSMAVNVMRWLGLRIELVDELLREDGRI